MVSRVESFLTYKQFIKGLCDEAALDTNTIFIGYNTIYGSRMYGTLSDVDKDRCLESPVAENLMMGMAIGMALHGQRPIVCFERHDFMLLALDALVNHADKLPWLSGGQFKLPILVRAIVGSKSPMDPGPQHRQCYTEALQLMLKHTEVYRPCHQEGFRSAWGRVGHSASGVVIVVEYKDDYEQELIESFKPRRTA